MGYYVVEVRENDPSSLTFTHKIIEVKIIADSVQEALAKVQVMFEALEEEEDWRPLEKCNSSQCCN